MQLLLEIILGGVFSVAFLSAVSLVINKWKDVNSRIFAILYFVLSFIFLADYLYLNNFLAFSVAFRWMHMLLMLSVYPLLFLYVKHRIEGYLDVKYVLLHFLFPLVFVAFSSVLYYGAFSPQERLHWLQKSNVVFEHQTAYTLLLLSRYIYVSIIVVQIVGYVLAAYREIKIYTRLIDENDCDDAFRFNSKLITLILVISAGILIFYISNISFNSPNELISIMPIWLFILGSVILVLLWFLFLGLLRDDKDCYVTEEGAGSSHIQVTDASDDDLLDSLLEYINRKGVFLNTELTITDVSKALGSNRTYVSRMFNCKLDTNFKTYVNNRRIDHAKTLIENGSVEISDLYVHCGFKSVSSFYKAFNIRSGTSPLKYKKTLNEKK